MFLYGVRQRRFGRQTVIRLRCVTATKRFALYGQKEDVDLS
jgi:hypothetical protein